MMFYIIVYYKGHIILSKMMSKQLKYVDKNHKMLAALLGNSIVLKI